MLDQGTIEIAGIPSRKDNDRRTISYSDTSGPNVLQGSLRDTQALKLSLRSHRCAGFIRKTLEVSRYDRAVRTKKNSY